MVETTVATRVGLKVVMTVVQRADPMAVNWAEEREDLTAD